MLQVKSKNRSIIAALIVGLLLLTGCTTMQQVEMEILTPASIAMPAYTKTLGIVDRSHLYEPDTPLYVNKATYLETNNISGEEVAEAVIDGFTNVMDYSPRFNWRKIEPVLDDVDDTAGYIGQNGWDQIRQICHDSVLDAIIVLRFTDIYDQVYHRWEPEQEVSAGSFIYVRNSWRIYDPVEMKILDDHVYLDSTYSLSEDDYLEYLFNLSLNRKKETLTACFWSGQKYAFRITPLWETVTRKYYIWRGEGPSSARQFVRGGDWLSAARIWNQETENANVKTAAKACFNMAVASEMEDNLELALFWARRSDTLVPGKVITQDYIQLLEERLQERQKLDQQMGID